MPASSPASPRVTPPYGGANYTAVTGVAAKTSLLGGGSATKGSLTIQPNSWAVGTQFQLSGMGKITVPAVSPATQTFAVELGGTNIAASPAVTPGLALTNVTWTFDITMTCLATGGSGVASIQCQGMVYCLGTASGSIGRMFPLNPQTTSTGIDLTAANLLDFLTTPSSALGTDSLAITFASLIRIN